MIDVDKKTFCGISIAIIGIAVSIFFDHGLISAIVASVTMVALFLIVFKSYLYIKENGFFDFLFSIFIIIIFIIVFFSISALIFGVSIFSVLFSVLCSIVSFAIFLLVKHWQIKSKAKTNRRVVRRIRPQPEKRVVRRIQPEKKWNNP